MNAERYEYHRSNNILIYEFYSSGPKGEIRKVIRFSPQNASGVTYFNLGFGDLDLKTGKIDDLSISNNQDRAKILGTIAAVVLEFTALFPDMMVYAKGSTPTRTRLYQIGIAANLHEIEVTLKVLGYINGEWQQFTKNINYEAFLILRK